MTQPSGPQCPHLYDDNDNSPSVTYTLGQLGRSHVMVQAGPGQAGSAQEGLADGTAA